MRSYSLELRERVIQAWQEGQRPSWRARTFRVSLSTLKEWSKRFRETGRVEALPRGHEAPLIKDNQASAVQALVDRSPDATLEQYWAAWEQEPGQGVSIATLGRALQRFDRPRKKTRVAAEREEPARPAWRELAETLPARRVTVFDESGTPLARASP